MLNCLCVGIGGFFGSVLRYLIGLIPVNPANGFPVKTLVINVLGAFVLGLISAIAAKNSHMSEQLTLMLKVGLCGGFTTFSTFAYETTSLVQNGSAGLGITYALLSMILGVAAVVFAQMIIS